MKKCAVLALAALAVSAQAIEMFHAEEVKPWQPPSAQPVPPPRPIPQPAPARRQGSSGAAALLGVWQTNIPGVAYTTPSSQPGYDILHVSSGAAAGLLRLDANGSYSWNSYGGKRGKWVQTGDAEYPIEIIDTVENKRWRVGLDPKSSELIVWSGSFWYRGRRAAVR